MAKSFSIKLGADTSDFIREMKAADKQINATQRSAQALDKALDLEFDASKAELAQKQFKKALDLTEQKAQKLRQQLKTLEDSGRIDTVDYQTLQTELVKTETKALKLKNRLEEVRNVKIEQVSQKFKDAGASIEKAGQKLTAFSVAAAGAIAGAVKLAKDAVNTGDEIATLADKYDMTTKAIQQWQYVAMQTDTSAEELLKGAAKIRAGFGAQAVGEINNVTKVLDELGVNIANFSGSEEVFEATILALSQVEDSTMQALYAQKLFGEDAAAKMLPLLTQGADAISKYSAEFEQVGYLSNETVKQLSALDNEVNKVTAQFQKAKTDLGVAMIPIYETLVKLLEEKVIPAIEKLADWFSGLSPSTQKAIMGLLGVIAVAAPLLVLVGKMSTGIGGLIKLFGKMKTASLSTAAGVAALAGALFLGLDLMNNWKEMSTIEKILKSLAVAALVAAAAMTVFHASWSVGIAVGAIAAGVVAGIAAIKAAAEDIGVDAEINENINAAKYDTSITGKELADINAEINKEVQLLGGGSAMYQNTENTSNDTYNIYIEANEYVNAEEVADIVSKRISTLKQSRG